MIAAAERAYAAGYRRMDAYTPFPVHGLDTALGHRGVRLPWIVLLGAIAGLIVGYGMQWYSATIAYPLNIGGRPFHSWPMFIPVTFELTILFGALGAVIGMLALNGLPQPYHPLFNIPSFELASRTHFFLCIEATDPAFDRVETRRFLESLAPNQVAEVVP